MIYYIIFILIYLYFITQYFILFLIFFIIFLSVSWGNLISNESYEIYQYRNYLVIDSDIKKYINKHTKYIQKELNKLNSYKDKPECYKSKNPYIYVLIVNPIEDYDRYETRNSRYDFWKPIYNLYNNKSRTYLKIIMKEKYKKYASKYL